MVMVVGSGPMVMYLEFMAFCWRIMGDLSQLKSEIRGSDFTYVVPILHDCVSHVISEIDALKSPYKCHIRYYMTRIPCNIEYLPRRRLQYSILHGLSALYFR